MLNRVGGFARTGLFMTMLVGCMGEPTDHGGTDVVNQASVSRPGPGKPTPQLPPSPEDERRQADEKRREEARKECAAIFECFTSPSCWDFVRSVGLEVDFTLKLLECGTRY
jgi:hypothetical protein